MKIEYHSATWFFCALLTAAVMDRAVAVTITKQQSPLEIAGENYTATVAPDGCLTNIHIGGKPFLAPGVNISRGSYFYHQGPLQLPTITRPDDTTIRADGDAASIEYKFDAEKMTWSLTNKLDEDMVFFLVLDSKVAAMRDAAGSMHKTVFQGAGKEATWFREDRSLTIQGSDKFWGPWNDCQVVEVSLPAGESRSLTLLVGKATEQDRKDVVALATPVTEADLVIRSPLDYQVFQRDALDTGVARISGRIAGDVDRVEAHLSGSSSHGELPDSWLPISWRETANQFQTSLRLPAGGWYELQLRALKGDQVVHEASVDHFGIGEVFVGAGQSNSTNCGQFKTQHTTGMVSSFGGDRWKIADDPQLGVADRSQGGSFWPAFGDRLYEELGVPIGVATTGYGGTSVNQWHPDDHLFKWMMNRMGQLGPYGFRAVLWHQGESDVHMDSGEYYQKLANVIGESKRSAGWEFPWYVAQVSYHNPDKPSFESTRSAHAKLWLDGVALEGPDTDTLTGDHRDMDGKGIHFSPKGLKAHGEMWAAAVLPYVLESTRELELSRD